MNSDVPHAEATVGQALEDSQPAMTPVKGLLILGGLIVVLGVYIALLTALGVSEMWAGFLFLAYWAGLERADFEKLPASVVGAFAGILFTYLYHGFGDVLGIGAAGVYCFLALILAVVYCQIMGYFAIAINMMSMLFLLVGTIPAVQETASVGGMAAALVLAIVYFAGLFWVGDKIRSRKDRSVSIGDSA